LVPGFIKYVELAPAAMNGEVVHFEVPAKDVHRAKAFYSKVFGWKTNDATMPSGDIYTSLMTTEVDEKMRPKSPGVINGGMMQLREPYTGPVVTIQVDDVTAALKSVESNGGKTVVKRTEMGQYGAYGYFKDPEGNLMGLFEAPKM
jgi:predicted enzyme related to lactoylglutathione lyase